MEWLQVFSIIAAFAAFFIWNRTESRSDIRHIESKIDTHIMAIQQEMRDFHGRLCAIEERKKSI